MPGFASVMRVKARWDVINFIRARAAAVLARGIGPEVTTAAALEVPDFAFERAGKQQTLEDALKRVPVLLVLFAAPTPVARLAQLAAEQRRLSAAVWMSSQLRSARQHGNPRRAGRRCPLSSMCRPM
jgi:hypothetical protein